VFAAWQRALAQRGLTAGRFYRVYSPEAAIPIEDPVRRARFEEKRDQDLAEIHGRMQQVEVERAYRIIGVLEKTAKSIEGDWVPRLRQAKEAWKRRVLWADGAIAVAGLVAALAGTVYAGWWQGLSFQPPWLGTTTPWVITGLWVVGAALLALALYVHLGVRRLAARSVARTLGADIPHAPSRESLQKAFAKNTRFPRTIFLSRPAGWGQRARRRIAEVVAEADRYVQRLNDRFTNVSGDSAPAGAPRADRGDLPGAAP
jgi:hypothetical protein